MRTRGEKQKYSNQKKTADLDCSVCLLRKEGCENAQEGKFCGKFRSRKFVPQGVDPNELWEKGEDVEFD